jgi:hypothetical protein
MTSSKGEATWQGMRDKTMYKKMALVAVCIVACAICAAAQTNTFPASGNVGIGTTNPSAALQVVGQGSASNGDRLGWRNFAQWYSWDGSAVHYYWNRLYLLPTEGHVTFQVYAKTDVNYPGFGIYTIDASSWNGQTVSLSVIPGETNKYSLGTVQAVIDSSSYVWVKVPAVWDSSVGFRTTFNQGVTELSSISYQEAAPSTFIVTEAQSMRATFPGLLVNYSAQSAAFIDANGNVGIGTTAPAARLDVNGSINISGSGAGITFPNGGGTQSVAWTGVLCGGDYAESVDVTGSRTNYGPGDLLVIDPNDSGRFLKSTEPYSTAVLGIYSTKPGALGRRQATPKSADEVPMAMIGIVPTKVSAENGAIRPGDLLVTSSTPGYAMKGTDRSRLVGAIIGKAMGRLDAGKGVIEVGVTLQ